MFCQKCGKKLNENNVCENCYPSNTKDNDTQNENENESNYSKQQFTFNDLFDGTSSSDDNINEKTKTKSESKSKTKTKSTSTDDELRDINSISSTEFISFVGENSAEYYIKKWNKSQKNTNFLSLNFPAFFTNFFWFWYRKMYRTAVTVFISSAISIVLLACLAIVIIAPLASDFIPRVSNHKWISLSICLLVPLVVSLNSNQLYIKHVTKKINKIKSKKSINLDNDTLLKNLRSRGGTTLTPLFFIIATLTLLLIYILVVVDPSIIIKCINYVLKFVRKLF